jgi:hypothetical protein
MIQIFVFVPEEHKEVVKSAMFEAGGGRIGHYDSCCFEHAGVGQFRPLEGSHAFLGKTGEIEKVREVKIEMVCEDHLFEEIIKAMKSAHPYEEPAFYGIKTVGYSV